MAKKTIGDKVNRSAAIRELFKAKPDIKVSEVITTLAAKGITISDHLGSDIGATAGGKLWGRLRGSLKERLEEAQRELAQLRAASSQPGGRNLPNIGK